MADKSCRAVQEVRRLIPDIDRRNTVLAGLSGRGKERLAEELRQQEFSRLLQTGQTVQLVPRE